YRGGNRGAVNVDVPLQQVPAARAHQQYGGHQIQGVAPAVRDDERDRALDRVAEVDLALDHVLPGRRIRVLEVGHEYVGAAIERVDHHLAVGGAGDLHAAV